MGVKIIVDSAADVAEQYRQRLTVVPLTVCFGEESYLDGVTLNKQEFYQKLVETDVVPTTSQATPDAFDQVFRQLALAGDSAVVITISSKLSGTYQSACIAAEDYDNIYVVDSLNVATGSGVLAEYALQCVDRGMGARELAEHLTKVREDIYVIALLDTLEYLKKGGRITPAAAAVGTVLNLKPVLTIQGEQLDAFAKVRGMKAAKKRMIAALEDDLNGRFSSIPRGELRLEAAHTCSDEEAFQWKQMLEEHFGQECDMSPLPLSIACHTGPGALGCAFTRQYIG